MFPSTPSPDLPLSPNVFLPPNLSFNNEKDCIRFNYNQINGDPFISDSYFFRSPSPVMENISAISQQQFSEEALLQSCGDAVVSCSKSKKKPRASKNDGHSKIYTARGPRDRRVRLSIDISRKFFCLQDLLGFDKPSKTLDWLFTKSKKAIKELVYHGSSSTVDDRSKADFLDSIKGDSDEDKEKKKMEMKCVDSKKKKVTPELVAGRFQANLDRDRSARAMARARARERTSDKMILKSLMRRF